MKKRSVKNPRVTPSKGCSKRRWLDMHSIEKFEPAIRMLGIIAGFTVPILLRFLEAHHERISR